MPEGHTIHRAARDQRPMLAGKVLDVSSPQGRFMEGAARLDGRRCTGIDPERAWARISRSRSTIGQLIMDQSVMAGIGNIYRSEILWRQRIHPDLPGQRLKRTEFDRIWADAVALLELGVKRNAIITVDGAKTSKSRYGERVNIFAKDTCPACAGPVSAFEIAGRRAACGSCQPAP